MKNLVLLFFFIIPLAAQTNEDSIKVDAFFKKAYGIYNTTEIENKKLTEKELHDLLVEYDDVISNCSFELSKYEYKKDIGHDYNPGRVYPSRILYKIWKLLGEKYGAKFINVLEAPYVVFAYILDNSGVKNIKLEDGSTFPIRLAKVRIDEVLKGEKYYKKGDTVTIKNVSAWFMDSHTSFGKGKSYFLAFKPIGEEKNDFILYSFKADNLVYLIKDGNVVDPDEFFETGEPLLPIDQFRKLFKETYLLKKE